MNAYPGCEHGNFVDTGQLDYYIDDWGGFLESGVEQKEMDELRLHTRTGRPLGDRWFIRMIEKTSGRAVKKLHPGPKPQKEAIK